MHFVSSSSLSLLQCTLRATTRCLCTLLCGIHQKLKLMPEEVIVENGSCLGSIQRKREYALLGFVKRSKSCICCRQVSWEAMFAMPGCCCCNKKITLEIVEALRERMLTRGTVGQMRKQAAAIPQLEESLRALDALVKSRGGAPAAQTIEDREVPVRVTGNKSYMHCLEFLTCRLLDFSRRSRHFLLCTCQVNMWDAKEYDMTNQFESLLTCCVTFGLAGFGRDKLKLSQDTIVYEEKDNFDTSTMEMDYAQLDSVDVTRSCCCFYTVK